MNLGPNIWGPHGWKFLHMVAIGYPNEPSEDQKKRYKSFFESIQYILPCPICSNNYKKHLKELPLTDEVLKNRQNLSHWTIDVHNIVNKEKGKKVWNYDDALLHIFNNYELTPEHENIKNENIEKMDNVEKEKNNFYPLWSMILLLVILVIIAVVYKKN